MSNLADSPAGMKILAAGINLGYGNTKVKTDGGYFQYVSDINQAPSRKVRGELGMENERTQLVRYGGKLYEVGDGANVLAAPRRRKIAYPFWAGCDHYMVLRQSVLERLAQEGADWIVTIGVPLNEMGDDKYTTKVQELWVGEHDTAYGPVRIRAAHIAAEPSGALFYYATYRSSLATLKMQNLTILDWGYFTTLGTTHHRLHLDNANTAQVNEGVSRVAEHVTNAIRVKYRDDRDVVEVEQAMLGQLKISIDNVNIDVQPLVETAVRDVGGDIISKLQSRIPEPARSIYLVGGGTHLFGKLVQEAYPDYKVELCDRPQEANAIGLHKMCELQLQRLMKVEGGLHSLWEQPLHKHTV